MKILKNKLCVLLLAVFLIPALRAQNLSLFFLKDTVYEYAGLKIKVGKSYWKHDVMKIKLTISNTNNYPVVIDPADIVMKDARGVEKSPKAEKLIIAPAKDLVRTRFVIRDLSLHSSEPLVLTIKKISATNPEPVTFSKMVFPAKLNTVIQEGSLSIKVIEVTNREKDYAVKVEMRHSGDKLLEILYPKASLVTESGTFYNNRRSSPYFYKTGSDQKMLMIFPYVKKPKEKGPVTVDLNSVFKEYTITSRQEYSMRFRPVSAQEYDNKQDEKEEKEDVIEEID